MPPSPPANPIAILIIIITIIIIIISSVHLAHHHFAERNVLGKPMSRAIQNDIQNIQKMLDKDIEDSSLSGKNYLLSSSPLIPVYLAGNPVTSYLSELCISPSEMRFKFLPTFIEFPSRPSPPSPPPHTLYLGSASEFRAPLNIWWSICLYHHHQPHFEPPRWKTSYTLIFSPRNCIGILH